MKNGDLRLSKTVPRSDLTPLEVERFWNVLCPYLAVLLNEELPLPDPNIDFTLLDPVNEKDKRRCMAMIHCSMWKGNYSVAVANIKAVRAFFRSEKEGGLSSSSASELADLKHVFERTPLER